jgi:ubiquinone/menaquinone biosynthesis C-methylase UbiE
MSRPRPFPALLLLLSGTVPSAFPQLGARTAAEWIDLLERDSRTSELKIDPVIARIGLKPGDRVADIGAGTGIFTRPFARAVAPDGIAYAVEVDRELVDYIDRRARDEKLENVKGVLGKFNDPLLPAHDLDVAFFHETIHHIEQRELYLERLAPHLKPNGRIVVIDMIHGHQDRPEMRISLDQVKGWLDRAGFQPIEEVPLYKDKFFVIFGRKP